MPCGLDYVYPKCNEALLKKILQNGGCIVSEYEVGTRPERWRFVARDRIQAMLSDKIVVVECEEKSGTMHTVKAGMEYEKSLACIVRAKEPVLPLFPKQTILHIVKVKKATEERTSGTFFFLA